MGCLVSSQENESMMMAAWGNALQFTPESNFGNVGRQDLKSRERTTAQRTNRPFAAFYWITSCNYEKHSQPLSFGYETQENGPKRD